MDTETSTLVKSRRRKERIWVASAFILILIAGSLGGWFYQFQSDLPLVINLLLFSLVNLNILLLLLLAYLVLRNIVKLLFERKKAVPGHKLRTRLVLAFVGLTLVPTLPVFWFAIQFISFSLDYWFSQQVERSLEESVHLGKDYLHEQEKALLHACQFVRSGIMEQLPGQVPTLAGMEQLRSSLLEPHHLDGIFFLDKSGNLVWELKQNHSPAVDDQALQQVISREAGNALPVQVITFENEREAIVAHLPVSFPGTSRPEEGNLVVLRFIPSSYTEKLAAISSGYEDYLQLKLLHLPLRTSNFITFSILTLMVVFAAIWFAFFLARNITTPIQALVSATRQVADGDLDVRLDYERDDDIGMLIGSFNKMVHDLSESRMQLADAYAALQQSHIELDERRRYMEIVLTNIAASVVSVDGEGRIVTMNSAAEATFGLDVGRVRGQHYSHFLRPEQMQIVNAFIDAHHRSQQTYIERQVHTSMVNHPITLLIKASLLRDFENRFMGAVIVIDDLTDFEKAQRMAAWREVARRIAHEIKNPLTPIQLSAQRLHRKYSDLLGDKESTFAECTQTIIQQVEQMKHLVDEFTNFARLPRALLTQCNLQLLVEESVAFYRHTYPHISFPFRKNGELPFLKLDRTQFKQVLTNLLDNAIHALDGETGTIEIGLSYDPGLKIARLEISDSGHGLSAEDKLRMFEPYYSTKEKGTGLGLTIVASIIADHNGYVRVRDNIPRGTVITIELPGDTHES